MHLLLAALAFGVLSHVSLDFTGQIERHVSAVWPASGLAMAMVFLGGRKFGIAIFAGALLSNTLITLREFPAMEIWRAVLSSSGIALGAMLEALAASWFLEHRAGGKRFCLSAVHATAFVLRVALVSSSLSALIGPSSLVLSGLIAPENWGLVMLTWFVGDATGILVFGAALVFPWRMIDRDSFRNRWPEGLVLCLALALVGGTTAGFYQGPMLQEWPRAYMILPVILWAVFRFNHVGTLVSLLIITLLSVCGAVMGNEVFPSDNPGFALFYLQMFLLIVSSVAWAVCGRVNELQILTSRLEDFVASRVVAQSERLRRREERLAVVAHDLQVPLIGIRNLVELLLQPNRVGTDPERSRKLLNEIGDASEQARALAGRLLEEREVDPLQPHAEPVDWPELLRGVARRASLLETSRQLRFVTQAEPSELHGSVDRMVFLQVLENLCHNAAKVSPHGGTITLGLREENEVVIITLKDEGPGFPPEELPTLFTKIGFHDRIRTLPESSGLGLFIVGKAVRALGGTITCESRKGQGATFTIRLPRRAA